MHSILNTLAHELISRLPPCVLVLDDYHVISAQPIHEAVTFLWDHVPALRWIITTRADPTLPLGRLRARQQLLEIRAVDLRFSERETTRLLNEVLQLALTEDAVQELQSKTEGWIAGLQLAGLAIQSSEDRVAFTREFLGSHRYIADYLADEVLHHLPDQTQHVLLQIAILDRLCAELCAAVIGDLSSAQAQLRLEELERANLFLIPLDDNRRWYRFHHLFADLLRQRLQRHHPHLVNLLHCRAAAWFAWQGQLDDAIRHWIAGQDFAQAADLLEQNQEALWMQGRFIMLQQWLALLPKPMIAERPRLLLAQAWTHVLTDAAATTITSLFQAAETAILHTADQGVDQPTTPTELEGVLAAIRALYYSKQEDHVGALAHAQRALACLPPSAGSWRSIALLSLGFAYEMQGDVRNAQASFTTAIRLCHAIGNAYSALVATRSLARTFLVQGQLRAAAATCTQGLAEAMGRGMGQLANTAHFLINLGRLHYEWNELALAAEHLQHGLAILQGYGANWLHFDGHISDKVDDFAPANRLEMPLVVTSINRKSVDVAQDKSKSQNLVEPLSDRELELLQLMAAGLSNQEIADRLFITVGTVKSHANHIFGKLGVQGRVKAINRARALALISTDLLTE